MARIACFDGATVDTAAIRTSLLASCVIARSSALVMRSSASAGSCSRKSARSAHARTTGTLSLQRSTAASSIDSKSSSDTSASSASAFIIWPTSWITRKRTALSFAALSLRSRAHTDSISASSTASPSAPCVVYATTNSTMRSTARSRLNTGSTHATHEKKSAANSSNGIEDCSLRSAAAHFLCLAHDSCAIEKMSSIEGWVERAGILVARAVGVRKERRKRMAGAAVA